MVQVCYSAIINNKKGVSNAAMEKVYGSNTAVEVPLPVFMPPDTWQTERKGKKTK